MVLPEELSCSSASPRDLPPDMADCQRHQRVSLRRSCLVVVAGIWLQISTGAAYNFSIYSETIKDTLGYNQQQLDSVSFAKDIGANVGILSGLLYDSAPAWITLAAAALLSLVGNLMMWLSITSRIATPPLWLVCVYALLAANSQTFSSTAAVVSCVKIFPKSRGTIVGLMKGTLGLSGAVLMQLYYAVYGSKPENFPLLMAWLAPTMCVFVMLLIRPLPAVEGKDQRKKLNMFSAVVFILAAYLLGVIILQNFVTLERGYRIIIFVGIVILLLLPLWVSLKSDSESQCNEFSGLLSKTTDKKGCPETSQYSDMQQEPLRSQGGSWFRQTPVTTDSLLTEPLHRKDMISSSHIVKGNAKLKLGDDFSLVQAISTLDFWFLFFASACGMGSGLTAINNMRQLGSSLNYNDVEINTFVSLWSIWNFLGRFGWGYVSELYFQHRGTARPLFISVSLAVMVVGHIIIAVAFPGALYVGPILVGICYGAQWSLMPSTASEFFGLKHFGAIFNTIAVSSPLSSYILSVQLTGYLYDVEARKGSLGSKYLWSASSCSGAHCFRLSFLVMAGVCLGGCAVSTWLFLRTRNFYKEQHLKLKRISEHETH